MPKDSDTVNADSSEPKLKIFKRYIPGYLPKIKPGAFKASSLPLGVTMEEFLRDQKYDARPRR